MIKADNILIFIMILIITYSAINDWCIQKRRNRKLRNYDKYYIKYNEIYNEIKREKYGIKTKLRIIRELEYKEKIYIDVLEGGIKSNNSLTILAIIISLTSTIISSTLTAMNSINTDKYQYFFRMLNIIVVISTIFLTAVGVLKCSQLIKDAFDEKKEKKAYSELQNVRLRLNIIKDILFEEDNIIL